jgi:hypothetical protein
MFSKAFGFDRGVRMRRKTTEAVTLVAAFLCIRPDLPVSPPKKERETVQGLWQQMFGESPKE